jgi:hypothetical protein
LKGLRGDRKVQLPDLRLRSTTQATSRSGYGYRPVKKIRNRSMTAGASND